ncbi:flagellar basal body rod protein [Bacillus sp. FJAT-49736]|uniref:lmo0954 family membrane protein n=1 Tax=Bacillus sp. FJAT-49736 TaxID=2833582 RepID=UPI001BCA1C84|nr:flagellar basal body rod protein [Bacillus sp. FJAT-49736]MBS4172351.1 flagellar basal body rod protein [Bacillus sp. FJAT-49736]
MKKVLIFGLAVILAIVALASLGHIIGLAISLIVVYFSFKQFLKSHSFCGKLLWALVGIAGLSAVVASLPALAGIIAIYLLYVGYKHWTEDEKTASAATSSNPFDNFDQQWNEMKKNFH